MNEKELVDKMTQDMQDNGVFVLHTSGKGVPQIYGADSVHQGWILCKSMPKLKKNAKKAYKGIATPAEAEFAKELHEKSGWWVSLVVYFKDGIYGYPYKGEDALDSERFLRYEELYKEYE